MLGALLCVAACRADSPTITFIPPLAAPVTQTPYSNGMVAWGDIPTSQLIGLPNFLLNADHEAWVMNQVLPEDTKVIMKCPDDYLGDVCDLYVYVYHCPPCALHGGLPGVLLSRGWMAGTCAPHFTLAPGGEVHNMAIFRRQLAKGKQTSFTSTLDGRFVGFGASSAGVDCSLIYHPFSCDQEQHCRWSADKSLCKSHWCPKLYTGSVTCTTCAGDDMAPPPRP